MLDNHTYNLAHQFVQENKSLWRIKNEYLKDAANCEECLAFWKKLEAEKEKHVEELTAILKRHM